LVMVGPQETLRDDRAIVRIGRVVSEHARR
jgi:hypothetical protein